jgi:hypothetical protein
MTLRIVSSGTTVIKSITVGTPVGIADVSVGRLTRLDDVHLGYDSTGLLPSEYSLFWNARTDRFEFGDPGIVIRGSLSAAVLGGDGDLQYDSGTGIFSYLGPTATDTRAHFSVVDSGGDGSLTYDSATGVFNYTGPSALETRAHISATNVSGNGFLVYDEGTGVISYTGPTPQDYRDQFSAVFQGGDGFFGYDSGAGTFTYRGPADSETRAHFSSGAGLSFSDSTGVFSITTVPGVAGSYGSTSEVPSLRINSLGQVDSIGVVPVAGVESTQWTPATNTLTIQTADSQTFLTEIDSFGRGLSVSSLVVDSAATFNSTLTVNDNLDLNGRLDIAGDVIPSTDLAYDLGDSTHRFNELWLAGQTIHLGNLLLRESDGQFIVTESDGTITKLQLGANTTDDLSEGSSNLYYTDQRARSAQSILNTSTEQYLFSYDSLTGVTSINDSDVARTDIHDVFHEGLDIPTGKKITFNDDFADIFENNGDLYIRRLNTAESGGDIFVTIKDGNSIQFDNTSGDRPIAHFHDQADVSLYYNGSKKFETTDSGARVTGNLDATGDLQIDGNTLITGNLQVDGTTTTINSTSLSVNDKNIILSDSAEDSASADGSGITVAGANAKITYNHSSSRWEFNRPFERNINLITDFSTSDLSEGTNRYYTGARADSDSRHSISISNTGGDGSLSYSAATGVIAYTGPSAAEVRAHLSAGRRLDYSAASGVYDVSYQDQAVAGDYGANNSVPVFTVDSHGLITSITSTAIASVTSFDYSSGSGEFTIGTTGSSFTTSYDLNVFSTDDLSEGTNLYYTKVRTDSDVNQGFSDRSTDDVVEGSNLYYTKVRVDSDVNQGFGDRTTTNVAEGDNLYYTKVRVDSDVNQGFGDRTTTDVAEGTNLYYTKGRVDSDVNQGFGDRSTTDVVEGTNLYYTKVRVDSDVNQGFGDRSTDDLIEGSNLYYTTARADSDAKNAIAVSGDLTYNAATGIISIDVEQIYSKANFDSDLGDASTTILPEGSNLYYTKTRVDSDVRQGFEDRSTDDLAEGDNLYYTTLRADSDARHAVSVVDNGGDGSLTYNNGTGDIVYTGPSASEIRAHFSSSADLSYDSATGQFSVDVEQVYSKANFDSDLGDASTTILPEGTNLYYTTARADSDAKNSVSVTDNGGDGALSYDPSSGIITYTGPSATEVRAHLSGGVGVTITDGVVEIGQEVDSAAAVTFASITNTSGDVTTLPSDVTISTTDETVIDQFVHSSTDVSFEYLIHMKDAGDDTQVTKMLGTFNGSAVASNEYGTVFTGSTDFGNLNITADGTHIKLVLEKYGSVGTVTAKASKTIIK